MTQNGGFTCCGVINAQQKPHGCCFATAAGANKAQNGAGGDAEGDVMNGRCVAKLFAQILRLNNKIVAHKTKRRYQTLMRPVPG